MHLSAAGAATDSLLRASVDARLKGKLQRGHAALSEFETNHMHRSQPVASPIVGDECLVASPGPLPAVQTPVYAPSIHYYRCLVTGIVSPDGKPYQRGVFTAVRPHKLSTETKDWREDRQYVGESPASFNNQVPLFPPLSVA